MKARCLVSFFAQDISGTQGTIIEVQDQQTFDELVKSGYVEAVDTQSENVSNDPEQLRVKHARAKKSDSNESQ